MNAGTLWTKNTVIACSCASLMFCAGTVLAACPPEESNDSASVSAPQPQSARAVPLLSDLPIIGKLFRQAGAMGAVADDEAPADGSHSKSSVRMNLNGESFAVDMENGEITRVEHNGERLNKDQYRKVKDGVEVLDKDGNVLQKLVISGGGASVAMPALPSVPLAPGQRIVRRFGGMNPDAQAEGFDKPLGAKGTLLKALVTSPPKVMLGITMRDSDNEGVIVDSVREGLPAEKAGIKKGDVIVRLDGDDVEDRDGFLKLLGKRTPGDATEVVVERDGEEVTLKVTLDEYDADKLGVPKNGQVRIEAFKDNGNGELLQWPGREGEMALNLRHMFPGGADNAELDTARAQLQEAQEQLRAAMDTINKEYMKDIVEVKKQATRAMADAVDALKAARAQLKQAGQGANMLLAPDMKFVMPQMPQAPEPPDAPVVPGLGQRGRVQELMELRAKSLQDRERALARVQERSGNADESRMKLLEERLKALEEQLEKERKDKR